MSKLTMLTHGMTAYITRGLAERLKIEELLSEVEEIKRNGLTPVFVDSLPSLSSANRTVNQLKAMKNDLSTAVAALAVLYPGNEAQHSLQSIQRLVAELGEIKGELGNYPFIKKDLHLNWVDEHYSISSTRITEKGYGGDTMTIAAIRKVAFRIIEYWLEGKTSYEVFNIGAREARIQNNGAEVRLGCKTFQRWQIEHIFVKLGYLSEDGHVLIKD